MRLPNLDVGLILRRIVAGERRVIVLELDDNVARAALSLDAGKFATAHDIASAEFVEDRRVRRRIGLVALVVVNVDAPDPVAFCHLCFSFSVQTSDCLISSWIASAVT